MRMKVFPKNLVLQILLIQYLAVSAVLGGQGWSHIPKIPAGRRAQYLLLKRDGGYKYGYDTGDGHSGFQAASGTNEVTGNYAYLDGDGQQQAVDYTSGIGGFVTNQHALIRNQAGSAVPPLPPAYSGIQGGPGSSDPSYNYAYDSGLVQHQETSDSGHNVIGSYQYTTDDGQHQVQYSAGPETGFTANVDGVQYPGSPPDDVNNHLNSQTEENFQVTQSIFPTSGTIPDDSQQATLNPVYSGPDLQSPTDDAAYTFSYSSESHSRDESSDSQGNVQGTYSYVDPTGTQQKIDYEAGDKTGFVVKKISSDSSQGHSVKGIKQRPIARDHFGQPPVGQTPIIPSPHDYDESGPSDASYNFAYNAGDHSRTESSDSNGNVQGSFSFVAKDDGLTRTVNYVGGANKGFVATGAHLPSLSSGHQTPVKPGIVKSLPSPPPPPQQVPQQNYIPAFPPLNGVDPISGPISSDGSYSFSYDTSDHSRTESGDANGNVRGSFSFIAKDDGVQRKVHYTAGSETGFLATGSHLPTPVLPQVPPILAKSPTFTPQSQQPVPYIPPQSGIGASDNTYSFSYEADDHSRTETGDGIGNVQGKFSFTPKNDGVQRTVEYAAGPDTGFIAVGAHLPVPVEIQPQQPITYTKTSFQPDAGTQYYVAQDEGSGDASYSYSYETDSSSKQETSDSNGNVAGTFSFLGGDGLSRTVQYTSKGKEGFIAHGDHLPKQGSGYNTIVTGISQHSKIQPPCKDTSIGIKGSSSSTTVRNSNNFLDKGLHRKTLTHNKSSNGKISDFLIRTYLPPDNEKFGYIYDSKGH